LMVTLDQLTLAWVVMVEGSESRVEMAVMRMGRQLAAERGVSGVQR
jgi:hypothetical protein